MISVLYVLCHNKQKKYIQKQRKLVYDGVAFEIRTKIDYRISGVKTTSYLSAIKQVFKSHCHTVNKNIFHID